MIYCIQIYENHCFNLGPDERRVQPTDDINPAEFVFNVFEDNVPDDLAAKNTGFFVNLKQETKDDRGENKLAAWL